MAGDGETTCGRWTGRQTVNAYCSGRQHEQAHRLKSHPTVAERRQMCIQAPAMRAAYLDGLLALAPPRAARTRSAVLVGVQRLPHLIRVGVH
jgi:hypothetical protein